MKLTLCSFLLPLLVSAEYPTYVANIVEVPGTSSGVTGTVVVFSAEPQQERQEAEIDAEWTRITRSPKLPNIYSNFVGPHFLGLFTNTSHG